MESNAIIQKKRLLVMTGMIILGVVIVMSIQFEIDIPAETVELKEEIKPSIPTTPAKEIVIPSRLRKVLGKRKSLITSDDELLSSSETDIDFLKNLTTFGSPTLSESDFYNDMTTLGFAKIPNMLSRDVAASLRKYLLSLLNADGVNWEPNEGDNENTLGRINKGMPSRFYKPLEKIMSDPQMIRYLNTLMPCKNLPEGSSKKFRMTQLFITINDRIKWHVDYPNQPPLEGGKSTMYGDKFCQYKTIYYLQDHNLEDEGNPSALFVVPETFSSVPHWTKCDKRNCSKARKGQIPSSEYTSTTLSPAMGDLLVMDARQLHAAAHNSLILPSPSVDPSPRLYKYRVFLQFLWGSHGNRLTDAMQKKKDKNLLTKYFKNTIFPTDG